MKNSKALSFVLATFGLAVKVTLVSALAAALHYGWAGRPYPTTVVVTLAAGALLFLALFLTGERKRRNERGVPVPLSALETGQTYELVGEPGHSGQGALHALICISKPGRRRFVIEVEPKFQHDFEFIREVSENRRFTYYERANDVPFSVLELRRGPHDSIPFVANCPAYGFDLAGKTSAWHTSPTSPPVWQTGLPTIGAQPSH